jgi:hypothetical protein
MKNVQDGAVKDDSASNHVLLSKSDWTINRVGAKSLIVGAHANCGYRHYTKIDLADLPNDLVSEDDLKRVGVDVVDGRAVI